MNSDSTLTMRPLTTLDMNLKLETASHTQGTLDPMERCFLFGLTPPLGATAIQGAPDPRRVHGGGSAEVGPALAGAGTIP